MRQEAGALTDISPTDLPVVGLSRLEGGPQERLAFLPNPLLCNVAQRHHADLLAAQAREQAVPTA